MCFRYISPADVEAMKRHFELEAAAYLAEFDLELFPKRLARWSCPAAGPR